MINMVFADIYSVFVLLAEGTVPEIPGDVKTIMLIAVFITNVPILMILLSRVLPLATNRWFNIVAGLLTIIYVVGGGDSTPHYIAAAVIEVAILGYIIQSAWRWKAA